MMWDSFGGNWLSTLFAFALIGIGIYIFINRRNDNEKIIDNLNIYGLHLSATDKKLAGVCGGIAESTNIDSTIIRLIWVMGTFLSYGVGIVLYIICMIVFSKSSDEKAETK